MKGAQRPSLSGGLRFVALAAVILAGAGGAVGHADGPGRNGAPDKVPPQAKFVITMRDGAYHVIVGEDPRRTEFELVAGLETVLTVRNKDTVAHEVISPLFTRTDVQFSGSATGIFKKEAGGFRLDPGKTMVLRFKVPFSDFRIMYDFFWCTLHGKPKGGAMAGEFLIVATKDLYSGDGVPDKDRRKREVSRGLRSAEAVGTL